MEDMGQTATFWRKRFPLLCQSGKCALSKFGGVTDRYVVSFGIYVFISSAVMYFYWKKLKFNRKSVIYGLFKGLETMFYMFIKRNII